MTTRRKTGEVKGHVKKAKADAKPKEEGQAARVPGSRSSGASGRAPVPARSPRRGGFPNSGSRTALQKHVDFFDTDRDGKITLLETYQGLRRLGLGAARSAVFGGVINAALGSSTSRAPSLTVDASHINAGKHASDTGVYDAKGRFVKRSFDRLFARYDEDGDGALDREELSRLFEEHRTDILGHLGSMAEFRLLLYLAGEDRKGRKVITRQRLEHFYDGSLFYQLADEVAARRTEVGASLSAAVRNGLEELY
jgi:peroxygenase